jgi:hypothetical protein
VENLSGTLLNDVSVTFSGGAGTWPLGVVSSGPGEKMVAGLSGPVPDSADISWRDQGDAMHKQHLQITPLPPPTATSYSGAERDIYFIIEQDGSVKLVYHFPQYAQ